MSELSKISPLPHLLSLGQAEFARTQLLVQNVRILPSGVVALIEAKFLHCLNSQCSDVQKHLRVHAARGGGKESTCAPSLVFWQRTRCLRLSGFDELSNSIRLPVAARSSSRGVPGVPALPGDLKESF